MTFPVFFGLLHIVRTPPTNEETAATIIYIVEPKMFALAVGGLVIVVAGIYFYKTNTNSPSPAPTLR